MDSIWSYFQNPFINSAKDNFTKFNIIVTYTYDRIKAKAGDAFFDELIADLETGYQSWKAIYVAWKTSSLAHKSATTAVKNLMKDLGKKKIRAWDTAIAGVYEEETPEYIALLGDGHAPFQTGTYIARLDAVAALVGAIGSDASLATLKASIISFQTTINTARGLQAAKLNDTDNLSGQLKLILEPVGKFMYLVLAKFMVHFYDNPTQAEPYFDLETIRRVMQVEFTKTVNATKTANIAKRKLTTENSIRVVNDGDAPITIYYAPEKNDPHTTYGVTIMPGEEEIFPASALGDLTTGNFIKAYNADAVNEAHFTISILK